MRLLIPSIVTLLAALSCPGAVPAWFAHASFGVRMPAGADPKIWVPRIADSGARYVVTDVPDRATAELAGQRGLMLLDRADYSNVGQWVPPGPLPRSKDGARWEARFAMTSDSGGATSRELIRLLIEVNSKGGNLLLSLPPNAEDGVRALAEIGRWLRVNGESIFDVSPSPFDRMPFFGRAMMKDRTLFLHLFQWPTNGKFVVPGLQNEIVSAELLGGGGKLAVTGATIDLPAAAPFAAASVVKVILDGPPEFQPYLLRPDQDGWIAARAESCEFESRPGMVIRRENRAGHVFLSHWTRAIDVPAWKVVVPKDGRYRVEILYSAGEASKDVLFTVTMKGPTMGMVKGTVESTGGAGRRFPVSDMELEAGNYMLLVQPENKADQPAMELEAVFLRRIGD